MSNLLMEDTEKAKNSLNEDEIKLLRDFRASSLQENVLRAADFYLMMVTDELVLLKKKKIGSTYYRKYVSRLSDRLRKRFHPDYEYWKKYNKTCKLIEMFYSSSDIRECIEGIKEIPRLAKGNKELEYVLKEWFSGIRGDGYFPDLLFKDPKIIPRDLCVENRDHEILQDWYRCIFKLPQMHLHPGERKYVTKYILPAEEFLNLSKEAVKNFKERVPRLLEEYPYLRDHLDSEILDFLATKK